MTKELINTTIINGLKGKGITVSKISPYVLDAFANIMYEAISVTRCSTLLPDELQPVLAKIEHTNSLGTSNYWEVVYYDNKNWHSFQESKTFEDGEKVVKWNYCKAIV